MKMRGTASRRYFYVHPTFERLFFRGPERNIRKARLSKQLCRNEAVIRRDKITVARLSHEFLDLEGCPMSLEMPGRETHKPAHVPSLRRGRNAVTKEIQRPWNFFPGGVIDPQPQAISKSRTDVIKQVYVLVPKIRKASLEFHVVTKPIGLMVGLDCQFQL